LRECHPEPSAGTDGSGAAGGMTLEASNELTAVSVLWSRLSSDWSAGADSTFAASARAMGFTRGGGLAWLFAGDCGMDSSDGVAVTGDGGNIT